MPVLNVGDFQMVVQTVQETQPSLKIMGQDGVVYYANAFIGQCPNSLKIANGEDIYTIGSRVLYYEATSFDKCESITLVPGCYTVEVMGGRGGVGGSSDSTTTGVATSETLSFSIDTDTTVYFFRGGDGNDGASGATNGSIHAGGGGGASGAPSFFQVGSQYVLSMGGDGTIGGKGTDYQGTELDCGGGGAGSVTSGGKGLDAVGTDDWVANGYVCSAGGGGAVGGLGGGATSGFLHSSVEGGGATSSGGGAGGDSSMSGLLGSSSGTGGAGGANVAWTCGSQTFYSYGGGGGGAVSTGGLFGSSKSANGGAGGSGSKGTSSVSYVKIYRFG